jgi:hypothetical protein
MADFNDQVNIWRAKAREGTLTKEEMRLAIEAMRASRGKTIPASGGTKVKAAAKAKAAKPNADDLLGELGL